MKKFIYSIIALAGLFAATSCLQEEPKVIMNPDDTTAPTLGAITGSTLQADSEDIVIDFGAVDYGFTCAKIYQLYVSATEDFEAAQKLSATYSDGKATIAAKTLNSAILNLGGTPGVEMQVYLRLSAYMANDKGNAIASSEAISEIISASFVPYSMLVLDKDTYEHVWVQGQYCGWDFASCQYLYNYNKDGETYTGIVDLSDQAANGIKFTGTNDWVDNLNWGSEAQAEEAEAASVQLISGGSSQNIVCYSNRFYMFSLNTNTLVLSKVYSFNKVSITGDFNNWAVPSGIDMEYNADYVRFYADITISEDTNLKFLADDAWALNWGVDCAQGGDNIPVAAGNYRAYLDLNKGEITFDATMYGKDEPTASEGSGDEEVDTFVGWSLNGTLGGSNWDVDTDMTSVSEGVYAARKVAITASDEFKIRENHDWKNSVGGPEANSTSTINEDNPYDVFKCTLGTAFATGGYNIQVGAEGVYNVTYDTNEGTILVEEYKPVYSLIGAINGTSWSADFDMTQEGDVWTSPAVTISGEFKVRYDYSWDDADTYGVGEGTTVTIGEPFTAVQPGGNISVPEGTYVVTFNAATKAVTVNETR